MPETRPVIRAYARVRYAELHAAALKNPRRVDRDCVTVRTSAGTAPALRIRMALTSRFCPVLGARVTVVTDLEANVMEVICRDHERESDACRLKTRASSGGRLSELLVRAAQGRFTDRTTRCQFD